MLVVQQVLPQPARHELRQHHGDVRRGIFALNLIDVLEQRIQQRPVRGLEDRQCHALAPAFPLRRAARSVLAGSSATYTPRTSAPRLLA